MLTAYLEDREERIAMAVVKRMFWMIVVAVLVAAWMAAATQSGQVPADLFSFYR